ncbi:hypothetical protein SAMN05421507_1405 [Lentzea jiangxiensis]|uniref:Uncharacterized protein n=1 Tax=Lentzea jiangxiensis TaxID=641025 RepID=A0A1H0X6B0_9PSEU|nr:hypothetical protein SAMN05421507_1405 [Lentzea jiangxiensis]
MLWGPLNEYAVQGASERLHRVRGLHRQQWRAFGSDRLPLVGLVAAGSGEPIEIDHPAPVALLPVLAVNTGRYFRRIRA